MVRVRDCALHCFGAENRTFHLSNGVQFASRGPAKWNQLNIILTGIWKGLTLQGEHQVQTSERNRVVSKEVSSEPSLLAIPLPHPHPLPLFSSFSFSFGIGPSLPTRVYAPLSRKRGKMENKSAPYSVSQEKKSPFGWV